MTKYKINLILALVFHLKLISQNFNFDSDIKISEEFRYFFNEPSFQGQEDFFPSYSLTPKFNIKFNDNNIIFRGFFRHDKDIRRTHVDLREFYYQTSISQYDFSIGYHQVFWGVVESNNLVDIINQNDAVESPFGNDKLGQPLSKFTYSSKNTGVFSFFLMPFHRKIVFPGKKARFRFPLVLNRNFIKYEKNNKKLKKDFAFRWNHYFDIVDIGLSYFNGNGREPIFNRNTFMAFYPMISQFGLDLQLTFETFLFKFEGIKRTADLQSFYAQVVGLEYTLNNVNGNGLDIGMISEYSYDDRGALAVNSLQNDVFIGTRFNWNDFSGTSLLVGLLSDIKYNSQSFSCDFSRRFKEVYKINLEFQYFLNIDSRELLLPFFINDHFFKIELSQFF